MAGKTEIVRPEAVFHRGFIARPRLIAMLSFGSTASLSLIQLSFISGNAASPAASAFVRLPSETRAMTPFYADIDERRRFLLLFFSG